MPGQGRDVVEGGAGTDGVLYDEREHGGATVTLDGKAHDGQAGEGDRVAPDVEDIVATSGSDRLVGSVNANGIDAGRATTRSHPGGGVDAVQAGPGNESPIFALDGAQDRIECEDGVRHRHDRRARRRRRLREPHHQS